MAFVRPKVATAPTDRRKEASQRAILMTCLAGVSAAYVNVSVLALAIGELSGEFDVLPSTMTWVVVGPMLAFAVFGPTAGKLSDLFGRRHSAIGALPWPAGRLWACSSGERCSTTPVGAGCSSCRFPSSSLLS